MKLLTIAIEYSPLSFWSVTSCFLPSIKMWLILMIWEQQTFSNFKIHFICFFINFQNKMFIEKRTSTYKFKKDILWQFVTLFKVIHNNLNCLKPNLYSKLYILGLLFFFISFFFSLENVQLNVVIRNRNSNKAKIFSFIRIGTEIIH